MSRTDKDKPVWVTTEWYEPFHGCGWYRKIVRMEWNDEDFEGRIPPLNSRAVYKWEYRGDCDLPAEPVRENTALRWRGRHKAARCTWDIVWPRERHFNTRGVRKTEYVRAGFHRPQRAAERVAARKVIQGDREAEFPDGRTRSSVKWDMW